MVVLNLNQEACKQSKNLVYPGFCSVSIHFVIRRLRLKNRRRLFLNQLEIFPVEYLNHRIRTAEVQAGPEQDFEQKQMEYDKFKEKAGYKNIQRISDSLTIAYNKVAANKIAFLLREPGQGIQV